MLQFVSSAMGATLYEDVTLDEEGNVVERHGYVLDGTNAREGYEFWFDARATDGRTLAEASTTSREQVARPLDAASRAPEAVVGLTLSVERPPRSRTDVKEAMSGRRD